MLTLRNVLACSEMFHALLFGTCIHWQVVRDIHAQIKKGAALDLAIDGLVTFIRIVAKPKLEWIKTELNVCRTLLESNKPAIIYINNFEELIDSYLYDYRNISEK